jgi:hypothetical protein
MRRVKVVYELKVSLRGSQPLIWRRFQVANDITLFRLHNILQLVMGWTNSHLHQFLVGHTYYGEPDPECGDDYEDDRRVRLSRVLRRPRDAMVYDYDFGDGWQHDIVLERIVELDPGAQYPYILAAEGACPPEDVGGIGGFYEFLRALADPRHPEHHDMKAWWGGPFDPKLYDIRARNEALVRRRRVPRPDA